MLMFIAFSKVCYSSKNENKLVKSISSKTT